MHAAVTGHTNLLRAESGIVLLWTCMNCINLYQINCASCVVSIYAGTPQDVCHLYCHDALFGPYRCLHY